MIVIMVFIVFEFEGIMMVLMWFFFIKWWSWFGGILVGLS